MIRGVAIHDCSWIRYVSDGTRIQVFSINRKCVIKYSPRANRRQLEMEIEARALAGGLSPKIIEYDADNGILVEQWMDIRPAAPMGISEAYDAFNILKQHYYRITSVDAEEYVESFYFWQDYKRLVSCLRKQGIAKLEVTPAHGDFWAGNIFRDSDGKTIILDWEYTGTYILSYDVWCYLFQMYRSSNRAFDDAYIIEFADILSRLYLNKVDIVTAKIYHLLHLLERHRLYLTLEMNEKKEELGYFENESRRWFEAINI